MQVLDGGPLERPLRTLTEELWSLERGGFVQAGDPEETMDWDRVRAIVLAWAGALRDAGVKAGDRVAILGETSRNWMLADHAIHALGAVVVPVYPTLQADMVQYILRDSGAALTFADPDQVEKADGTVWAWGDIPDATPLDAPVKTDLDDPALLIYTSGTTGTPKGVLLDHRNLDGDVQAAIAGAELDKVDEPSLVAFLPLAHIAGYVSLHAITALHGTLYFSRPDRMSEDLQRFRPTIVLAVPRLWERIMRKVEEAVAEAGGLKAKLFGRAKKVALAAGEAMDAGGTVPTGLRLRHGLYERLIYSKVRAKLGMDRVQVAVTGAAAVRPDLLWWLRGMGLPIIEGYGMTESAALVTCTRVRDWKAGTVGAPLPGVKIALDDGEVLIGGLTVFREYWGLPEETAQTRVIIDDEPWIRSGDLGEFEDGRLRIVDRKKELEVLDTGKKIAPVRVEELLKSESSFVEDSCLIGTDRAFASALIQPSYDALLRWALEEDVPVEGVIMAVAPTGEEQAYGVGRTMLEHPKVQALFQAAIDRVNARVADFERIRAFKLVPDAFTIDREELTPSFKKKRKTIIAHYQADIDAMYG